MEELRAALSRRAALLRTFVPFFEGPEHDESNVLRRSATGEIVLTDGFRVNGTAFLEQIRVDPEPLLVRYDPAALEVFLDAPVLADVAVDDVRRRLRALR